jgi:excinuclease ABC subunit C
VVTQQQVVYSSLADADVVGVASQGLFSCVQVFSIRGGRLVSREHFVLEAQGEETPAEIVWSFVIQYYSQTSDIPDELVLPVAPDDVEAIRVWLADRRAEAGGGRRRVRVGAPRTGENRKLIELACENAREVLERLQQQWLADEARTTGAVVELQELLDLPQLPNRIECYDISHVQGTNQVGSMVVFENGQPRRSAYKRFKIKGEHGNNDTLSMQEVLGRRFRRALTGQLRRAGEEGSWESSEPGPEEGSAAAEGDWTTMPDLIIIDGGKGQLNAALEVLDGMEITELPVVGLAKEQEEVFVRDRASGQARPDPILLPRTSQAMFLVQRIRDEAHRFAITYHRAVRGRSGLRSALDEVEGIGPKRKRELLRRFGSVKGIRSATLEELAAVPGMTLKQAKVLKTSL